MIIIKEGMLPPDEGSVITIGNFDGVHIAHRALIRATVEKAREMGLPSLVWSFKEHPLSVLRTASFKYLIGSEDKIRQIERLGADYYYGADFASLKDMEAAQFVKEVLVDTFKVKHLFCGFDFSFGKGGKGTPETLRTLLADYGVGVTVLPAVMCEGEAVSSTRLRALITEGDMERAAKQLGRYYSFKLPVSEGRRIGRTLGSPTINQQFPADRALPAFGVYAVFCDIEGCIYGGVANIGVRPTVTGGDSDAVCETHIFDFSGDLYGKEVRVYLYKRLREEKRFQSLTELSEQIARDAVRARQVIEGAEAPKGEQLCLKK